jgi:hypothetical protein
MKIDSGIRISIRFYYSVLFGDRILFPKSCLGFNSAPLLSLFLYKVFQKVSYPFVVYQRYIEFCEAGNRIFSR